MQIKSIFRTKIRINVSCATFKAVYAAKLINNASPVLLSVEFLILTISPNLSAFDAIYLGV